MNINEKIKLQLLNIRLKINRIIGKSGALSPKTQDYGKLENIFNIINSSIVDLQLYV